MQLSILLCVVILFLSSNFLFAQNKERDSILINSYKLDSIKLANSKVDSIKKIAFKLSPFGFIDFDRTVWLSAEIKLNSKFSFQQDLGYIHDGYRFDSRLDKEGLSFHLKSELRGYFQKYVFHGGYFAPQFFFKQINFKSDEESHCLEWSSGVYDSTSQLTTYTCLNHELSIRKTKRTLAGINFKVGYQSIIKKYFLLDIYLGVGARYADNQIKLETRKGDSYTSYSMNDSNADALDPGFFIFKGFVAGEYEGVMVNLVAGMTVGVIF